MVGCWLYVVEILGRYLLSHFGLQLGRNGKETLPLQPSAHGSKWQYNVHLYSQRSEAYHLVPQL